MSTSIIDNEQGVAFARFDQKCNLMQVLDEIAEYAFRRCRKVEVVRFNHDMHSRLRNELHKHCNLAILDGSPLPKMPKMDQTVYCGPFGDIHIEPTLGMFSYAVIVGRSSGLPTMVYISLIDIEAIRLIREHGELI